MKKFNLFKMLAVLIVLITSLTTQVWAYNSIKLRSNYYTGGWSYVSEAFTYGGEGAKYWDVYHTGADSYWRLHSDYYNTDYEPYSNNYVLGGTGYRVKKGGTNCFKTTGKAGIIRICTKQYDYGATDELPDVWIERPGVVFKHNWNGGGDSDWTEKNATDNEDGTYTYTGTYGGTPYFNAKSVNGAFKVAKTTTTVIGSPDTGDQCEFKWTPSGYKLTGGEEDNRGVFVITKLVNVTYNAGSYAEGGSAPSDQEGLLYGSTVTLATNSGSLTRSGYAFTGWNTEDNGSGDHYDAEQSVELSGDINLYPEWTEATWAIKGGDSESADGTSDKMGNWGVLNNLKKVAENTYRGTISLDADKIYHFYVINQANNDEYGKQFSSGDSFIFVGQTGPMSMATSAQKCRLATGNAGEYTFEFNSSSHELTIKYPNGDKHPSTNFVYWTNPVPWWTIKGYIFAISGVAGDNNLTSWDDSPELSTTTIGGNTYYFAAIGNREKIIFRGATDYETKWYQTITLSASSHKGQYSTNGNTSGGQAEAWSSFSATVTLDEQSGPAVSNNQSVQFNGSTLSSITPPTWPGYEFGGYWSNQDCDETKDIKVINADGSWVANASGYTSSSKWIHDGGDATLYAKWTPVTLTFNGVYWNVEASWTPACVPTIEHDVIIQSSVSITTLDARAKSIRFDKTGEGGSDRMIRIYDNGGLLVKEDIKVKNDAEAGYVDHTTSEDLFIETSTSGNGGLIVGGASIDTETDYRFNIKAYRVGSFYINQYIGIPMTSLNVYEFYDSYMFEYDNVNDQWASAPSVMRPFTAYNIIRAYTRGLTFTYFDGILNLPGIESPNCKVALNCGARCNASGTFDGASQVPAQTAGDHMFANSWAAPIDIASIDAEDMPAAYFTRTIYIFNAGYEDGRERTLGDIAGQWSSFPIESAKYMEEAVIPASQAFLVTSKVANATLTLDYYKHVYKPAIDNECIMNTPLKAPRRIGTTSEPNVLKMVVKGDSAHADNLYLLERADFTTSFDNGWDGEKVFGLDAVPQLYALSGEDKMAVNAIPEMDGIELGFKAGTIENGYTFSFEYNNEEPLYLYDKDTQEFTQINNETTYSFTTSDTDEHARFLITRSNSPAVVTAIEEGKDVKRAEKYIENGQLFILRGGRIYNATGALVK